MYLVTYQTHPEILKLEFTTHTQHEFINFFPNTILKPSHNSTILFTPKYFLLINIANYCEDVFLNALYNDILRLLKFHNIPWMTTEQQYSDVVVGTKSLNDINLIISNLS